MNPPPPLNPDPESRPSPQSQTYKVVTDLVAGPNVRLKDNLYQGLFILASTLLGVAIGAWKNSPEDRTPGMLIGGLCGVVAGLLLSGIFLMIFRAVRHVKGKHD